MEPEVSLYLRVCQVCKEKLVDWQVRRQEEEAREDDGRWNFLEALVRLNEKFSHNEERVRNQLPKVIDVEL